jgi:phosphoglycerate dehydrogenase-like enzyme
MNNMINVLVTLDLSKEDRARIQEASERVRLTVIPANGLEEVSKQRWAEAEVLFTQRFLPDPAIAPKLRWVQVNSAGIDAFIENPLVRSRDVVVTTMSGVITNQIAEYILMAMLAFGQKLPKLLQYQQDRNWPEEDEKWGKLLPIDLRHSTVGILGYGSIGRQVARLLKPFGAKVLAVKKDVMHPEDTGYIREGMGDPHGDFFDRLYPIEALHSFLKAVDFLVLTLPLTGATRHILDSQAFTVMKESAYLVNVGRGKLIDQPALVNALKAKQIAGAALDVFEEEPLPENNPLWGMENVIISPHISGLSQNLREDTLSLFIENLNRYLAELPLYNQVDAGKGY